MILAPEQDTLSRINHPVILHPDSVQSDTAAFCFRNSILDITFTSGNSFFKDLTIPDVDRTIENIALQTGIRKTTERLILEKHLRDGENIRSYETRDDWFLFPIIIAFLLLTVIRAASKNFNPFLRFFLFRGINDPEARETGGLFYWQNTIFNFLSFLVISMFIYRTALHFDLIPSGMGNALFWLLSLAAVMISLTLRHIVCLITGNLSEQRDLFNEYLMSIYQFYQYSALFLLIPVILVSYTAALPSKAVLIAGFLILGLMYLIRMGRLLVIFVNRNISIFYLILYLCALEILPVSLLIRYFSDRA